MLEDEIFSLLEAGSVPEVEIIGGPLAGKTTALAHLASLPWADRLAMFDEGRRIDDGTIRGRLLVFASRREIRNDVRRLQMARWSDDDLIEYLLAEHPQQCASVMTRLGNDPSRALLAGIPGMLRMVADSMAADPSLNDVARTVRRGLADLAGDEELLGVAREYSLGKLRGEIHQPLKALARLSAFQGVKRKLFPCLGIPWVRALLASDLLADEVRSRKSIPAAVYPRDLVLETARLAREDPQLLNAFHAIAESWRQDKACIPMFASILHNADASWRPSGWRLRHLQKAYLSGADWDGIDLANANLNSADLHGSRLTRATFTSASLHETDLSDCDLSESLFDRCNAKGIDFRSSKLTRSDLSHGSFISAKFDQADLSRLIAENSEFRKASLRNAVLRQAQLRGCDFRKAALDDCDFTGANLQDANLTNANLRSVELLGADFGGANLTGADLEYVRAPRSNFRGATLSRAWMTGSVLTAADLSYSQLSGAGLADIEWEMADLRNADLRGCSFHMGSSRSGLVGSPYPCHGSRTGFYTDDYDAQTYKAPEEIRKANLYGADLRGARIAGVDFYLVDLRCAIYDADQEQHFRQCDAILTSRVS